jgi:hypothetical protein
MSKGYTVIDLTNYFNISKPTVRKYLNQLEEDKPELITRGKYNKYLLQEDGLQYFEKILNNNTLYTNERLLKFIICDGFKSLTEENDDFILQFTKRTCLEQKKDITEFDELPQFIQTKYQKFALSVLNWLKTKFLSADLTKVIIDRLPKWDIIDKDKTDIRITLYESSHPYDINLIIKEEINNLQEMQLDNLQLKLQSFDQLIPIEVDSLFDNPDKFIQNLGELLKKIEDKRLIKKIFKFIVGSKPCYKIVAEPEIVIMDFTKLDLPSTVNVEYTGQELILKFNNGCHLTAQLSKIDDYLTLIINFISNV